MPNMKARVRRGRYPRKGIRLDKNRILDAMIERY
jgi:hypothetical protein